MNINKRRRCPFPAEVCAVSTGVRGGKVDKFEVRRRRH